MGGSAGSPYLHFFLALLLWGLPTSALQASKEEAILLAFRDAIDNWEEVYQARGWRGWRACQPGSCDPVCTWTGVECDFLGPKASGDQVASLQLPCEHGCSVPAVGRLIPELALLDHLQTLDLSGNGFYGTLPPEWGYNDTFPQLTLLNLNSNNLSGPIPDAWSENYGWVSLAEMHLANNQLTGTIGDAWALTETTWYSLMVWNVGNNRLSGTLPQKVNGIASMATVSFQGNMLTGPLPAEWGRGAWTYYNLTEANATQALEELYLNDNMLTGSLPTEWGSPESFGVLKTLTVGGNPLGAELPASWGTGGGWRALETFNASLAGLRGPLPEAWGGGFPALRMLEVAGNELSGSVPASWAGMPKLAKLMMQPGNPQLCTEAPEGAAFKLCSQGDSLCRAPMQPSNSSACSAGHGSGSSAGGSPAGGGSSGGSVAAPSPAPPADSDSDSGGVPVAAIVAPVVGGVAIAAGLAAVLLLYRRRQQRQQAGAEKAAGSAPPSDAVFYAKDAVDGKHEPRDLEAARVWAHGNGLDDSAMPMESHSRPSRPPPPQPSAWRLLCAGALTESEHGPPSDPSNSSLGSKRRWSLAGFFRAHSDPGPGPGQPAAAPAAPGAGVDSAGSSGSGSGGSSGSVGVLQSSPFTHAELEAYLSDWQILPEEIQILRRPDNTLWQLGTGGFGKVFKAMRNGVQPVAVKLLSADCEAPMNEAAFHHEIAVLRACRDTNIVQFQGVCFHPEGTMLVTEYMEGGNLFNNIRRGLVSWHRHGKRIALEVARGLVFLHTRRIIHLDVKSANVMLTKQGSAKIGDVGNSKVVSTFTEHVTANMGTLAWAPPEMLWGQKCTAKSDIYSFGVVLWEIVTGEQPQRGQMRDVLVPEECPAAVRDIILRCLESEPAARPSALQLVELLQAVPDAPPGASPGPIRAARSA